MSLSSNWELWYLDTNAHFLCFTHACASIFAERILINFDFRFQSYWTTKMAKIAKTHEGKIIYLQSVLKYYYNLILLTSVS